MGLIYNDHGNLEDGIYDMTIDEVREKFCFTEIRKWLFEGLLIAIEHLRKVGCTTIYLDGSFVTKKRNPTDYDMCWDDTGFNLINVKKICPELLDPGWKNKKMLERYRGEVIPMNNTNPVTGINYFSLFTKDKENATTKGIIRVKI